MSEQVRQVLTELEDFLDGAKPLNGSWFGEPQPGIKGAYWWRKHMHEVFAQVRALLAREAVEVPQWQPIETAPKDKHLLLSDGERVSYGGWTSDLDQGADYEGQLGMAGWWSVDLGPNGDRPTHWMPLPASPTKGQL